jgi:acetyl esterase
VPRGFRASPGFGALRAALSLPEPAIRRIVGPPLEVDGRTLDPAVQLLLHLERRALFLAGDRTDVARRREVLVRAASVAMPRARGVHAWDRTIPGPGGPLRVRVYRSHAARAQPPAIVYLHGGGFVVGDLASHDGSCRLLARETGAVVMAVDYRRAPEDPFPAGTLDAMAAFRWAWANPRELAIRPGAVALLGDSAGGNLAAVVCQQARDEDGPMPIAQGLLYPATDLRGHTKSMQLFSDGYFLTSADIGWFLDQYLPDPGLVDSPAVSPLLAEDLAGLPPTHIWTGGFDPLRDEGRAYADRLAAAGVLVRYRCLDDQVHGFFGMGALPYGLDMARGICREVRELLVLGLGLVSG